jgi:hypothetical protein
MNKPPDFHACPFFTAMIGLDDGLGAGAETAPLRVKFRLESVVATPGALCYIGEEEILAALDRHQAGEWVNLGRRTYKRTTRL